MNVDPILPSVCAGSPGESRAGKGAALFLYAFPAILVAYVVPRAAAWYRTFLFEDHDGLGYLRSLRAFVSLDPQQILALDPDANPMYPLFAAVISAFGFELEHAARLTSMAFSVLLLVATIGIGRRLARPAAVVCAALLLCFHPLLVLVSKSILAEATYVGLVYAGLWLFWKRFERPSTGSALLLGVIYGAAFLTRLEGLLLLAAVPAWQIGHYLFASARTYDARRLARFVGAYLVAFALTAAPQVWRVSESMGSFAINGRQAWSVLLTPPPGSPLVGAGLDRAIYGLDFSPETINLEYMQANPEARRQAEGNASLRAYVRLAWKNFDKVYRDQLGLHTGPVLLVFCAAGLFSLYAAGRRYEAVLILSLPLLFLAAPLLQSYLQGRHVVVLIPITCLMAGIGIVATGTAVGRIHGSARLATLLTGAFLALTIGMWALPLRGAILHPPSGPFLDDRVAMDGMVTAIRDVVARDPEADPMLACRMAYIPYYAGTPWVSMPFTDYAGLVKYLDLNGVDYLVLEHAKMRGRPFTEAFRGPTPPPDFTLLHREVDEKGQAIELYRFRGAGQRSS
jgi:hypothetical protein